MGPPVAGLHDDVLPRVANDDDGLDVVRGLGERAGDGGADLGAPLGGDPLFGAEPLAELAHHVRALDGDLARERVGHLGREARGRVPEALALQHLLQRRERRRPRDEVVEGDVGEALLVGNDLGVAVSAGGGDDDLGAGGVDAVGERLGAEAAEDRRVDDAEALGRLRVVELLEDVRQVEGDAVALAEAEAREHFGAHDRLDEELPVADRLLDDGAPLAAVLGRVPAVALEEERGLLAVAGQEVPVDLVEAGVRLRADVPAIERSVRVVESCLPRAPVARRRVRGRLARRRVEAAPRAREGIPPPPGLPRIVVPMELGGRDVAVERPGITQGLGARIALVLGARKAPKDLRARSVGHARSSARRAAQGERAGFAGPHGNAGQT